MIKIPKHPDIEKYNSIYERIKVLIENDESKYTRKDFFFRLPNEPTNAYIKRRQWFKPSFINITTDLLSAPRDAIFKESIRLEFPDNNVLNAWAKDVTKENEKVTFRQYLHDTVAIGLRAYGTVFTVIDKSDYEFSNREDEIKYGLPYLTNISPLDVLNWEFDQFGELLWFAYKVNYREKWFNPTKPEPKNIDEIRIWTQNELIISEDGKIKNVKEHNLGFVPVVYQALFLPIDIDTIIGISPFFMSSNMIIMANNMKSIGDMDLTKHGSSILLVHEDALGASNVQVDENGVPTSKFHDADGVNAYVWNGEHPPEYLTKDLGSIEKSVMRANDYFFAAIQNERSMQSIVKKGKTGNDVMESGIAKVIDAMPVMASLNDTSRDLEMWAKKVVSMVARMINDDDSNVIIQFPKRFDIAYRSLDLSLRSIIMMLKSRYPSEKGIKEMFKSITDDISNDIDIQTEINSEIDNAEFDAESALQNALNEESLNDTSEEVIE